MHFVEYCSLFFYFPHFFLLNGDPGSVDYFAFKSIVRPDRQGTRFTRMGIVTMTVRGPVVELIHHPLPAFHEIGAVIVKTYILKVGCPGGVIRILPFFHRLSAVRTICFIFLVHNNLKQTSLKRLNVK